MITAENYFSHENQLKYMGSSQVKSMMACEAGALAEIRGEFPRKISTALLVGSYIDAHFEKTLGLFKAQNPGIFTEGGDLKAEYRHAEYIIQRIERDPMFMRYMDGEKQVIKTGKIDGVPFKIKIDSYHPSKCIVDLKVMRDFGPVWKDGQGRITFIDAWGYDIQGAIYQAIEGNKLPFFIAAASKQDEPDIEIFQIEQHNLDAALELIRPLLRRFDQIKRGEIEPSRCETCAYCRHTKILTEVKGLDDLRFC